MKHLGLVVEGPGDREAVRLLVRQHLFASGEFGLRIGLPWSGNGREKLLADDKLEDFVAGAARVPGAAGVLVVFDAEGDAACELGPESLARAQSATELPVRVCIAVRCFENWIAASVETVFDEVEPLADCEGKGAIGLIKEGMHPTKYVKTVHQARLASRIDQSLACDKSPSLARFFRCIDELVAVA